MVAKAKFTPEDLEAIYRSQSRRVFATLVRLLGEFDLAEEALHDAFLAAAAQWPHEGMPANAAAWLISVGRFRSIDRLRRRARFSAAQAEITDTLYANTTQETDAGEAKGDDRLSLIFTCCHPTISPDAQVALTLREVCGLTTEEIARAFLAAPATIAQRIVRAKSKIRETRVPFEMPPSSELGERLEAALRVIYLVFNEGYSAAQGDALTRPDLSGEAIRLGRLLAELLPDAEAMGLLALMLFHEARREARLSPDGEMVLMADQDRTLWKPYLIAEGVRQLRRALATRRFGAYTLQAAIAALHAEAPSAGETNWAEIVGFYDLLLHMEPSPLVMLNRAVAIAMRDGPEAALPLIDEILRDGTLSAYHLAHAARADLCRRLGRTGEARRSYETALGLVQQEPERRFLARRIAELG